MRQRSTTPPLMEPAERNALADKLKVNRAWFYQCLTGRGEMSAIEASRIERETNKYITRQMLCQRTYKLIWPELAQKEAQARQRRLKARKKTNAG